MPPQYYCFEVTCREDWLGGVSSFPSDKSFGHLHLNCVRSQKFEITLFSTIERERETPLVKDRGGRKAGNVKKNIDETLEKTLN